MTLSPSNRLDLYGARRYLDSELERRLGIRIPFEVYLQDPLVAKEDPDLAYDDKFYVEWEPGLADGPTSARFAVVDYNGDTGKLIPPVSWDGEESRFLRKDGTVIDRPTVDDLQSHQANVWAILQRALRFFEEPWGLGRSLPWGFEGNRLIVVPHAGYGENAFYDRRSKSLQFYYFDSSGDRIYTCLSTDIINHEFGHAVLDGTRPYFMESTSVQTGAFHEFIGDLTAILLLLRNNPFRKKLAEATKGDISEAEHLTSIAEQFGKEVKGKPYLRSARSPLKLSEVIDDPRPHHVSQVLTGAMFDIIMAISNHYIEVRGQTAPTAFWNTIQRMQRWALQPLDLLPPVDVTFKDYALAVLRAADLANPTDPWGYRALILKVFHDREILDDGDLQELSKPHYLYEKLPLSVYHDITSISRSRSSAYRFLDDNREDLFIPSNRDLEVVDVCSASKFARGAFRLPTQFVVQYVWREDVRLDGSEFGPYQGKRTEMLCGGTLVFDENTNLLSWTRKPGTEFAEGRRGEAEAEAGRLRRDEMLGQIANGVRRGLVGDPVECGAGMIGRRMPPLVERTVNGTLRFELSPHLTLTDEEEDQSTGERRWQMSS